MKNIDKVSDRNQIDLLSLNKFFIEKGDDELEYLLWNNQLIDTNYSNERIQNYIIKRFQPNEIKNEFYLSYKFCEKIVTKDGMALMYVPEHLKDYNLCEKAVNNEPYAIHFIPKTIENYYELVKIVFKLAVKWKLKESEIFKYISRDDLIQLKKDFPEHIDFFDELNLKEYISKEVRKLLKEQIFKNKNYLIKNIK
jgi:hypothetical protein